MHRGSSGDPPALCWFYANGAIIEVKWSHNRGHLTASTDFNVGVAPIGSYFLTACVASAMLPSLTRGIVTISLERVVSTPGMKQGACRAKPLRGSAQLPKCPILLHSGKAPYWDCVFTMPPSFTRGMVTISLVRNGGQHPWHKASGMLGQSGFALLKHRSTPNLLRSLGSRPKIASAKIDP